MIRIFVGVKKRRAYEVLEELEEWDSPHDWFQAKAIEGFKSGHIDPGRAVLPSSIADAFFTTLAGGVGYITSLRNSFGARSQLILHNVLEEWDELNREIIDYMVYSRLLFGGSEKNIKNISSWEVRTYQFGTKNCESSSP